MQSRFDVCSVEVERERLFICERSSKKVRWYDVSNMGATYTMEYLRETKDVPQNWPLQINRV